MEGEEYLVLQLWGQMLVFNMNIFYPISGGIRGGVPVPTPLESDERIVFDDEKLPSCAGLFFDESKVYLLGGLLPHFNASIRRDGISSTMYMADLSHPILKFSKLHKFEGLKSTSPILMKKQGRIYALSTDLYPDTANRADAYFDVYDPCESVVTRLPIPPFFDRSRFSKNPSLHNRKKWRPTGAAVVGDTLCVETYSDYHFYHFDSMKWMNRPRYSNRLLHFITYNNLERQLCHGHFVKGCEDVLVSIGTNIHGKMLQAALLPPVETNYAPGFLYQHFTEVNQELREISECHGRISNGMVMNMDRQKMCAVFQCEDKYDIMNRFLYIFIFEVSKLPGLEPPCVTDLNLDGRLRIQRDFISVTPLHKGFYQLDECAGDLPALYGAFIIRDRKVVGSHR